MKDTEFLKLADKTLNLIDHIINEEDEDCLIDIDFQGDILTLNTDQGTFVVNKNSAIKEIWLSSPISGPYHFAYIDGIWKSNSNYNLMDILECELKINFNKFFKKL